MCVNTYPTVMAHHFFASGEWFESTGSNMYYNAHVQCTLTSIQNLSNVDAVLI